MSDLDQISAAIGAINARLDSGDAKFERLFVKLDQLDSKLHPCVELMHRLEDVEPHVEDYKRLKQRGLGVLCIIALGASGASLFANKIWERIFPP